MCGMTRPADAHAAAVAGASAIGIVFWPGSPRAVDIPTARAIVAALPAGVPAIGVFVNQPLEEIDAAIDGAGLFGVQLHGDEPIDMIARIRRPVIRAVSLESIENLDAVPSHVTVLLDAHDPQRRGGTGRTIDWNAAAAIARRRPIVLAGGLTPRNAADAISTVRPYAVDVASGIESAPGIKDHQLMKEFVDAVRRASEAGEASCA